MMERQKLQSGLSGLQRKGGTSQTQLELCVLEFASNFNLELIANAVMGVARELEACKVGKTKNDAASVQEAAVELLKVVTAELLNPISKMAFINHGAKNLDSKRVLIEVGPLPDTAGTFHKEDSWPEDTKRDYDARTVLSADVLLPVLKTVNSTEASFILLELMFHEGYHWLEEQVAGATRARGGDERSESSPHALTVMIMPQVAKIINEMPQAEKLRRTDFLDQVMNNFVHIAATNPIGLIILECSARGISLDERTLGALKFFAELKNGNTVEKILRDNAGLP